MMFALLRCFYRAPLVLFALAGSLAQAQPAQLPPIKIGWIMSYTGPVAYAGEASDRAFKMFFAERGDTVAGRKVEIIRRDTTGPAPDLVTRQVQELIVRDKVDILAGMDYTPNYLAAASLSTKAKKPLLLVQPSFTNAIVKQPYAVRFSWVMPLLSEKLGIWAPKNNIKRVFNLVTEIQSFIDAEDQFTKTFTSAGGTIVGGVRMPLRSADYSGYLQRVKDAKPDAVFLGIPAGAPAIGFLKAWHDAGLASSGIKLLDMMGIADEHTLDSAGDTAIGVISASMYARGYDSPANRTFIKRHKEMFAGQEPNWVTVITYDIMTAFYRVVEAQQGQVDPERTIELLRGMKFESPRGPIAIDENRDVVQNVYIGRVESRGGKPTNVVIDTFTAVKNTLASKN